MNKFLRIAGIERIVGIPLIGLLLPHILDPEENGKDYWYNVIEASAYALLLWEGNWHIISIMRRKFSGYYETGKRLIFQLGSCFIYTTIATVLLGVIIDRILNLPFRIPPSECDFFTSYIVTFLVISIYESVYFSNRWKEELLESEMLKRNNLQSQFESLKTQISPHFLFNSLNTLITIIPEAPDQAVQFVQKLANVYRYILLTKEKELVSLNQEIDFAKAYLFLMKMRFGENLQISWEVNTDTEAMNIPPLALQMLIENAIKHNVVSAQKPLTLQIYTSAPDTLVVKNNLQRKFDAPEAEANSTKIGLNNIIRRYSYLTKWPVNVSEASGSFTVTLPLLQLS